MDNKRENIDNYFNKSLENFEVNPDISVWHHISKKLEHKGRKKIVFYITRIAAGIALLAATAITIYYIGNESEEAAPDVAERIETGSASTSQDSPAEISIPEGQTSGAEKVFIEIMPEDKPQIASAGDMKEVGTEITGQPVEAILAVSVAVDRQESNEEFPLNRMKSIHYEILPVTNQNENLKTVYDREASTLQYETAMVDEFDLYEENGVSRASHWILGGEFAPVYSYRYISSDYLDKQTIENLNAFENGLLVYAGGLHVAYSPVKRLAIQTGISYSRYGQQKENVFVYNYDGNQELLAIDGDVARRYAIQNSTGTISSQFALGNDDHLNIIESSIASLRQNSAKVEDNISAIQYFDFLELPLILKYNVVDRKLDFGLMGGLVTNLMIGNRVYLKENGDSRLFGETEDIRDINWVGMIGLGIAYPFSDHFTFHLEPRFRYYLNPIDKTPQLNVYPYSFGIFTGISFTL